MKVELTIADDRELRSAIKDEIKGTVVSIARGEIRGILADVVKEGVVPSNPRDTEKIVREEIHKIVAESLQSRGYGDSVVKTIAREEVRALLKETLAKGELV